MDDMTDLKKKLEGSGGGLWEVLSRYLPEGTEVTPRNPSVRIADVLTKIQTKCISNMGQVVRRPVWFHGTKSYLKRLS
jgi:hypothetical protein